jgi:hypothetical protein
MRRSASRSRCHSSRIANSTRSRRPSSTRNQPSRQRIKRPVVVTVDHDGPSRTGSRDHQLGSASCTRFTAPRTVPRDVSPTRQTPHETARSTVHGFKGKTTPNTVLIGSQIPQPCRLICSVLAASTPATSGQVPALALSADGVATVQLASVGHDGGPSQIDLVLDSSVVWTIDLDGGATQEHVDMRGGVVDMVDLTAGTTRATIILPERQGNPTRARSGWRERVDRDRSCHGRCSDSRGRRRRRRPGRRDHAHRCSRWHHLRRHRYPRAPQRLDVQLVGGVSSVQVH